MRRIAEANADLIGAMGPAKPTAEQYSLFRAYLETRHPDGGMADMSVLDYSMMIEDSHIDTHVIEYRRRGTGPFHHQARRRPPLRRLPDRSARRRAFDGLFLLRPRGEPPLARRHS